MVLVSFVLVVVAAITLAIGLLQSGLGIIYVSIACSVLAGVVLFIAVLRGRPSESRTGGMPTPRPAPQPVSTGPAPAPGSWQPASPPPPPPPPPPTSVEREPAFVGAAAGGAGAAAADRTETLDQAEIEDAVASGDAFPIHDYDSLRATEILPMLADLSDDQLEAVQAREQAGKGRSMILKRIGDELETRRPADGWDADDEGWDDSIGAGADIDDDDVAPPSAGADEFPIAGYEELKALDVLVRLPDLSVAELRAVRRREEQGLRRAMVMNRIDRLIEEAPPEEEVLVVAPPKRKYTRKAAAAPTDAPARRARAPRPAGAAAATGAAGAPAAKKAAAKRAAAKRATEAPAGADGPAPRARAAKAAPAKARTAKAAPAKAATKARTAKAAPAKAATKRSSRR